MRFVTSTDFFAPSPPLASCQAATHFGLACRVTLFTNTPNLVGLMNPIPPMAHIWEWGLSTNGQQSESGIWSVSSRRLPQYVRLETTRRQRTRTTLRGKNLLLTGAIPSSARFSGSSRYHEVNKSRKQYVRHAYGNEVARVTQFALPRMKTFSERHIQLFLWN